MILFIIQRQHQQLHCENNIQMLVHLDEREFYCKETLSGAQFITTVKKLDY